MQTLSSSTLSTPRPESARREEFAPSAPPSREPRHVHGPAAIGSRRQESAFRNMVLVTDALVVAGSGVAAYYLRASIGGFGALLPLASYLWLLPTTVAIWCLVGYLQGATSVATYRRRWPLVMATLKSHAIAALVLLSALYLLRAVEVSRLLTQVFLLTAAAALVAERLAIHAIVERRARTQRRARLLVVGATTAAARLQSRLADNPHWGAEVAAMISTSAAPAINFFCGVPVLGRLADVPSLLDTMVFDEVVVADGRLSARELDRLVQLCLERGLTFQKLVQMPDAPDVRHHAESLGDGLYFVALETAPRDPARLAIKRIIDLGGGLVGLAICAVTFIVVAPLIRLTSPGPVIFRQVRVGRNGRRFTLYKFRTMSVDAESRKLALAHANQLRGPVFKIWNDPRVTPVGRFLRRTYLDELPQFWNVVRGDMSLVGTRPPTPDEVSQYEPRHRRRLTVQPGLTGEWQCRGNGMVDDFEQIVRMDCEYIERWSLTRDLRILLRTCLTLVRMAGH